MEIRLPSTSTASGDVYTVKPSPPSYELTYQTTQTAMTPLLPSPITPPESTALASTVPTSFGGALTELDNQMA